MPNLNQPGSGYEPEEGFRPEPEPEQQRRPKRNGNTIAVISLIAAIVALAVSLFGLFTVQRVDNAFAKYSEEMNTYLNEVEAGLKERPTKEQVGLQIADAGRFYTSVVEIFGSVEAREELLMRTVSIDTSWTESDEISKIDTVREFVSLIDVVGIRGAKPPVQLTQISQPTGEKESAPAAVVATKRKTIF